MQFYCIFGIAHAEGKVQLNAPVIFDIAYTPHRLKKALQKKI